MRRRRATSDDVVVYPLDWNPYQRLLYDAMRAQTPRRRVTIVRRYPRVGLALLPAQFAWHRIRGARLLHLHWPAFDVHARLPGRRQLTVLSRRAFVTGLRAIGYHIVWTVHNIVPHDGKEGSDIDFSRRLSRVADATIVHSPSVLAEMSTHGLETSRSVVIPHGNYLGVYPPGRSRSELRQSWGAGPDTLVVLAFGAIRPYKGIEELLDAWARVGRSDVQLVVAGDCSDAELRSRLLQSAATVRFLDGRVADAAVAELFEAADAFCAPFQSVTTSGSVLLSLSFGLPVIAPRLGALRDLPPDTGFYYDSSAGDSLADLLAGLEMSTVKGRGQAAATYAAELSWADIARETSDVYRRVRASNCDGQHGLRDEGHQRLASTGEQLRR